MEKLYALCFHFVAGDRERLKNTKNYRNKAFIIKLNRISIILLYNEQPLYNTILLHNGCSLIEYHKSLFILIAVVGMTKSLKRNSHNVLV